MPFENSASHHVAVTLQRIFKVSLSQKGTCSVHSAPPAILTCSCPTNILILATPSGRTVYGACLRPIACWDCGSESRQWHGWLSLVSVVCVVR
jgi:hypothetical protein